MSDSGTENIETRAGELSYLGIRQTAHMLVNSFRFSQGDTDLQHAILWYFAQRFGDRIDAQAVSTSTSMAAEMTWAIQTNPKSHARTAAAMAMTAPIQNKSVLLMLRGQNKINVDIYADALTDYLSAEPKKKPTHTGIDYIARQMIQKDYLKLHLDTDSSGRPRKSSAKVTSRNDRFFSFWTYYGLMDASTTMPEYDAMFDDVVVGFNLNHGYDADTREKSAKLASFYLKHHEAKAGRQAMIQRQMSLLMPMMVSSK